MHKAPEAITVLVADDHPVVREGIVAMVEQQPDLRVVAECADGRDALAAWREHRPQVTLLDLETGAHGGIETLLAIRREDPTARVLVLTTYDLEEDIFRCVQAGACAYLLKDIPRRELLDAIRRVRRGEKVFPAVVAAKLAERLGGEQPTARELDVLRLLAEGLANKQIAHQLGVAEATVKTHVNGLMQKLGAASRTEAVTRAQAKGWLRR
jgi:DNA-binding NarL/FixJ family response regulator